MSNLLPIIEQLADAKTHRERRQWLCRCPCWILRKYEMTIVNRLEHAVFPEGIAYLRLLNSTDHMVREDDGLLPVATAVALGDALIDMDRAVDQSEQMAPIGVTDL